MAAPTPKRFYDLLSDQDDSTQAIHFFQNLPTDQRYEVGSYRDQAGRTPLYIARRCY